MGFKLLTALLQLMKLRHLAAISIVTHSVFIAPRQSAGVFSVGEFLCVLFIALLLC